MSSALLLLPDFSLILIGWLLVRYTSFDRVFWSGVERLVYFVLFPALLLQSTNSAQLDFSSTSAMLGLGLLVMGFGMAAGYAVRWVLRPDPVAFASGLQTAFRFNSYIGLALAARLGGGTGLAMMALLVGFTVPLANVVAVWALARHGESRLLAELARNPLILATAAGLGTNLLGLHAPEVLATTLNRLGSASTALGLITVGAGLQLRAASGSVGAMTWWTVVKLVAMPAFAWLVGRHLPLTPLQLQMVVLYASLPTASSCYILAVRMGGNGPMVAATISAMTVGAIVTMPFWMALLV
ncbi:permease [Cupriavidus sp. USMAA2-4]|uniref:Permease n=1 Tax=Cupriavidus malaysiensis TaxID=367825 RepID=A0ABN4TME6_9BURK|nr:MULTISPECIES: AEC family transporter [Cupriavidus]AOY91635.1 permease [Cupriavidus sp. USMAA2-4]AOY98815.1 permease [Cupriavidus sp. USMAHM13]AOZ05239.1 permease [Cupriavidus malaysiensis]